MSIEHAHEKRHTHRPVRWLKGKVLATNGRSSIPGTCMTEGERGLPPTSGPLTSLCMLETHMYMPGPANHPPGGSPVKEKIKSKKEIFFYNKILLEQPGGYLIKAAACNYPVLQRGIMK